MNTPFKTYTHQASVVGLNGTTQSEVILWQFIGPFSVVLRNAAIPWLFMGRPFRATNKYWLKFMLDFVLLVMPVLLSMTVFEKRIAMILLAQGIALVSLLMFYSYEYCYFSCDKPPIRLILNQVIDDQHTPTIFITYIRSMMLIGTGIAILAVDLEVFPRRFAKTETYGHSIMDVGVSTFVFCAALISAFKQYPTKQMSEAADIPSRLSVLKSPTMILLYLGIGRSLVLKAIGYPEHVSEYGVHWNFFITLACIRIVTKLLGRRFHLLFGVMFAGAYQFLLQEGEFQEWLLSEKVERNDLVSANREGMFSLLGYLAFYYLSSVMANFVASTGIRLKSWLYRALQLLLWASVLFGLQKLSESFFGIPSRRLVNLPYIMEMLVFHTLFTAGFLFVQIASMFGWAAQTSQFSQDESPFEVVNPCLLCAVNRHALTFFMLCNLTTGLVNISGIAQLCTDDIMQTSFIGLYILIVCAVCFALDKRRNLS